MYCTFRLLINFKHFGKIAYDIIFVTELDGVLNTLQINLPDRLALNIKPAF